MKKVAIAYRGFFNYKKYSKEGLYQGYFSEIENALNNHKKMIHSYFDDYEIDCFFSTYDIDKKIEEIYKTNLEVKNISYLRKDGWYDSWKPLLHHTQNLINDIEEYIERTRNQYDFLVFTRPDILFKSHINSFSIDTNKFNITLEHLSGNCDDNLWIFPIKYFQSFKESINELNLKNMISHEINYCLKKRGVSINYMTNYAPNPESDGSDMGHKVFSFCR